MNNFLYNINKAKIMLRVGLLTLVVGLVVISTYFKDSITSTLEALSEPAISSTEKQKNSQEKGLALPPKDTSSAQPTDFKASSATDKTPDVRNIISANRMKIKISAQKGDLEPKEEKPPVTKEPTLADKEPSNLIGSGGSVEMDFNVDLGAIDDPTLLALLQSKALILVLTDKNGGALKQGNFTNTSTISGAIFEKVNIPHISNLSERVKHSTLTRLVKNQSIVWDLHLEGWLYLSNSLANELQERSNSSMGNIFTPKLTNEQINWNKNV